MPLDLVCSSSQGGATDFKSRDWIMGQDIKQTMLTKSLLKTLMRDHAIFNMIKSLIRSRT